MNCGCSAADRGLILFGVHMELARRVSKRSGEGNDSLRSESTPALGMSLDIPAAQAAGCPISYNPSLGGTMVAVFSKPATLSPINRGAKVRISSQVRNAYLTIAAVGFPAFVFLAAASQSASPKQEFGEITVQRINVVEPDGSLKIVISNSALQHPGVIAGDTIMPDRVRPAGMTFFDDRGDEMGGFGITGDGERRWGGMLFDQIDNDETLRFTSQQGYRDGQFVHQAGMSITDRNPEISLPEMMRYMREVEAIEDPVERQARVEALEREGVFPANRLFVGRRASGEVTVDLHDDDGRPRLRMLVEPGGAARIEFLDEGGNVVRTLGAP
jgi:hypothetical protein